MLQNGTPYPMVGFMAGCAVLSLAGFLLPRRLTSNTPDRPRSSRASQRQQPEAVARLQALAGSVRQELGVEGLLQRGCGFWKSSFRQPCLGTGAARVCKGLHEYVLCIFPKVGLVRKSSLRRWRCSTMLARQLRLRRRGCNWCLRRCRSTTTRLLFTAFFAPMPNSSISSTRLATSRRSRALVGEPCLFLDPKVEVALVERRTSFGHRMRACHVTALISAELTV